jgi:amidase
MNDPHPRSAELGFLSASEMLRRFEVGDLTSTDVVAMLQERIAEVDAPDSEVALNSIAALSVDARNVARVLDDERAQGIRRGPLHGVPVLIKDNIEAVGLPGLAGSTALVGRPSRDSTIVTRLRDAGAIVLASTNLSQWANIRSPRSTSGYSSSGGLVANPWSLERSAGGSSSGSGAALAAGLAPLAVGTETDGSIICPASVNGVVGLKPTVGVVPTTHVVPISASQDSPGPMGRSVEDVALLFGVLAGGEVPASPAVATFAVATNWRTGHPKTDALFDEVIDLLRRGGLEVTDREVAQPDNQVFQDEGTVLLAELFDDLTAYLAERPGEGVRSLADVIAYEDEHAETELRYFGHEQFVTAMDTKGRGGEQYEGARARNLAWAIETCLTPALEGVDFLLAPAYGPSWKSDLILGGLTGASTPVTMAPAIAGWPIIGLPFGVVEGLPVGLAIVGRANSEWSLLRAARRVEELVPHTKHDARPQWTAPSRG